MDDDYLRSDYDGGRSYQSVIEAHARLSVTAFWWQIADLKWEQMRQAESEMDYFWARDQRRAALWNAVLEIPKPNVAAIYQDPGGLWPIYEGQTLCARTPITLSTA